MLLGAARQDILERISSKLGYEINEASLSPALRHAIFSLANVEKSYSVIKQVCDAEKNRRENNLIARAISKYEKNDFDQQANEVKKLRDSIDSKVNELAKRILVEGAFVHGAEVGPPMPGQTNGNLLTPLKCPNCGANLPFPSSELVKCAYCSGTSIISSLQGQLASIVQQI